jgi:trk system potassium uptake protein
MKKQIVVIGLGRFGASLATKLFSMGHDVLALDNDEKNVTNISTQVTRAIQVDPTNEAALKELGVGNFDVGIVAKGYNIMESILCTAILKNLGVKYIVSRAKDELHGNILSRIGADKVYHPERASGVRIAHSIVLPNVQDDLPLTPEYSVMKLLAPSYFANRTLSELEFGRTGKWRIAVLLVQRQKEITATPAPNHIVLEGDVLIVSGTDDDLEQLLKAARKS